MYKLKALCLNMVLIVLLSACVDENNNNDIPTTNQTRIDELWAGLISNLLQDPLWLPRDKYDASTVLMLPMVWSFEKNDLIKINEFSFFFNELSNNYSESIGENRVANAQFQYFVSQYLMLKQQNEGLNGSDLHLLKQLTLWAIDFWQSPAWLWGREPFSNMQERLIWKLKTFEPEKSYYRALFDEELFLLATVANLTAIDASIIAKFDDLKSIVWKILQQEINYSLQENSQSYFSFQIGVWSEHPDYLYAGQDEITEELEASPILNISTDSSHMHRWPLWLNSFAKIFVNDKEKYIHVSLLKEALALQFSNFVYVKATSDFLAPRINNYFDGRNGVYRYKYTTQDNSGYAPYQLSGSLVAGWYGGLLFADNFALDIENTLSNGSLPANVIDTYTGPNTTRERHQIFTWPQYFYNGMAELNFRISYELLQ